MSTNEIEQLEQADEQFLRTFLEAGRGCPKEMLYLETGTVPIRFTIYKRRLMFLHYLLNEDDDSMINKFLMSQTRSPCKNDWTKTIEKDLNFLEIYLSYEEIRNCSENQFRTFVDQTCKKKALEHLTTLKLKHSKVLDIKHSSLKMQSYFEPENVWSVQLSKFIFQARTRMTDVKCNFKEKHTGEGLECELGCKEQDSQQHLLNCEKISETSVSENKIAKYDDLLFPNVETQKKVGAVMMERLKKKEKIYKREEDLRNFLRDPW